MSSHEPEYNDLKKTSKDLFKTAKNETVSRDVPETEKKVEHMTQRWDKLNKGTKDRKDKVDKLKASITKYSDTKQPLLQTLQQFEDAVKSEPSFGTDTKKASDELERIEDLMRKLDALEPQLKSLNKTSSDLENLVDSYDGDKTPVKKETDHINERFKQLRGKIGDRKTDLEKVNRVLAQFLTVVDDAKDWCDKTDKVIDDLTPVNKQPEDAKKQIHKIDVSHGMPSLDLMCRNIIIQHNSYLTGSSEHCFVSSLIRAYDLFSFRIKSFVYNKTPVAT